MKINELTTQRGFKVKVKEYITIRELRALTASVKEMGFTLADAGENEDVQNKMFESVITEIDGNADVKEAILDLPASDFMEVMEEVNKAFGVSDKKKVKIKTSN